MQPEEKCQNCGKMFPESKVNSHFGYCRRNIKKCEVCKEMVDINYLEEHNQEFHTKQNCKHCRRAFEPKEIAKHEGTCPSRPKYCEFCQQNVPVSEFDKHVSVCGARTKQCPRCQRNIIMRDFDVHSISCNGKVISVSPPPVRVDPPAREVQKKIQPARREERPQAPTNATFNKPQVFSYKPEKPEIYQPPKRNQPSYNIAPREPLKAPVIPGDKSSNPFSKQPEPVRQIDTRPKDMKKPIFPDKQPSTNDRYNPPTYVPSSSNQIKRDSGERPKPSQPQPNVPSTQQRSNSNSNQLYEQQRNHLKEYERQKQQANTRPSQSPIYNPPSNPYVPSNTDTMAIDEDESIQAAIFESMGMGKKKLDFQIDQMSQSFIRDLQLQDQIESSFNQRPSNRANTYNRR